VRRPAERLHQHPLVNRIRAFDDAVDRAIEPFRSRTLDRVFYPLSSAADHGLLWLAIGSVRGAVVPRHARNVLRLGAVMGVESLVTNLVIKSFFQRVRPELGQTPPSGKLPYGMHRPITSAFPSGHATSAFTASGFLSEADPLAPVYKGLAVLVAASRVYVRMHHASDVIVGSLLGRAFGKVARRVARAGLSG